MTKKVCLVRSSKVPILTLKFILYTFQSGANQGEMRQKPFSDAHKTMVLSKTWAERTLSTVHSNHMLRKSLNVVLVLHLIKLLVPRFIRLEKNSSFQTKHALPKNKHFRLLRPKSKVLRPYSNTPNMAKRKSSNNQ